MEILENVLLAPMTTFGIGGRAHYFVRAGSLETLKEAVALAQEKSLSFFALGGGSNVLIRDEGFAGLVIKIELQGVSIERGSVERHHGDSSGEALLVAAAGESWDAVVRRAVAENLWGIENLSGIPGQVGGAVVQNIGAYGQALSEVVKWVEIFDTQTGAVQKMTASECAFDYRDSFFKHDAARHIVLSAAFKLSMVPQPNLSYRDLAEHFAGNKAPAIAEVRTAVLGIRKEKFPDLTREGTAGSFFKNPILSGQALQSLKERFPGMPLFPMPETAGVKVPLAWLLDHHLHLNGFRQGKARLFERQPLVIAVDPGASASEVRALALTVRAKVRAAFGFEIAEEVKIL